MTVPDGRYRAIRHTEDFLFSLLDLKMTPRVPKEIRKRARSLLKHFPSEFYLGIAREKSPRRFW